MKHFLSITDLSKKEFLKLIKRSQEVKKHPKKYHKTLYEKTLMTFFQLPSLRTEVSFDVAMFQMGGEIIDYHAETSPWAKGKESISDVAKVVSRYCDAVMMRIPDHQAFLTFAKHATIPVINGLTTLEHPCQIVADMMTIMEKKKRLNNIKITYVGDANNNVTHSLMLAATIFEFELAIACPHNKTFMPQPSIVNLTNKRITNNNANIWVTDNVQEAAKNADVIYTDSWMSYHIKPAEKKKRIQALKPFQVNQSLMNHAKKSAIFMHCLPAKRGLEVTKNVIDGPQSVVFDQAENRLHTEKAILLKLLKKR